MAFTIAILGISLSLDALGVGFVYGLRKTRIPIGSKLIICLLSMMYSCIALAIGKSLSTVLSPGISKLIGVGILIFMGLWIIIQACIKKPQKGISDNPVITRNETLFKIVIKSLGITIQVVRNPIEGDIDKSGVIDVFESILLGLALSIDAIGVGIGSALSGFHSAAIPPTVGLCQLAFLYSGTYLGEKFADNTSGKISKRFLAFLPGVLLISLALLRIR